jgi:AraC-like DNA-binding protein
MRRVVVAADAKSTLALLSELRGAIRMHARGDRGGMRLEHDNVGPVGIDRTTFDVDLDADVGLAQAFPGDGTTVTAVGYRWGFPSPSRFAQHYRDAYGVPPSDTLHS